MRNVIAFGSLLASVNGLLVFSRQVIRLPDRSGSSEQNKRHGRYATYKYADVQTVYLVIKERYALWRVVLRNSKVAVHLVIVFFSLKISFVKYTDAKFGLFTTCYYSYLILLLNICKKYLSSLWKSLIIALFVLFVIILFESNC